MLVAASGGRRLSVMLIGVMVPGAVGGGRRLAAMLGAAGGGRCLSVMLVGVMVPGAAGVGRRLSVMGAVGTVFW